MKQLLIFFIVFILFSSSTCNKDKVDCVERYELILPISITHKDTFKIGDTIWIEAIAANKELKFKSKEGSIKIANWDMGVKMSLYRLDTLANINNPNSFRAAHFFNYVNSVGEIDVFHGTVKSYLSLRFDTLNNHQICRIAAIPTKKGIFTFSFYFEPEDELKNKPPLASGCIDVPSLRFVTNDGDYNYYLQQKSLGLPVDSEDVLLYSGSYAFVVIP